MNINIDEHIFHKSPIGIAIVGLDGIWLDANHKLIEILEYSLPELQKMKWQEITHPADLPTDLELVGQVTKKIITNYEMLKRYITKSGRVVWVRLTVWPIVEDDKVIKFVAQIQPLVNGHKEKIEQLGNNTLQIRPQLTIGEFIADNWKTFIAAGIFTCTILVGIGVGLWGLAGQVESLQTEIFSERQIRIEDNKVRIKQNELLFKLLEERLNDNPR